MCPPQLTCAAPPPYSLYTPRRAPIQNGTDTTGRSGQPDRTPPHLPGRYLATRS